jgi:hypothetical protein
VGERGIKPWKSSAVFAESTSFTRNQWRIKEIARYLLGW